MPEQSKHLNAVSMNPSTMSEASNTKGLSQPGKNKEPAPQDKQIPRDKPSGPTRLGLGG